MKKEVLEIIGGQCLNGKTSVYSAKNAVLPMLAGAMLTKDEVTIKDCPFITDIDNMFKIREILSVNTIWQGRDIVASGAVQNNHIPEALANVMRSSIFMLGPLLVEVGDVKLHLPGGCKIGARPIDIHLDGLEKLGAKIEVLDNSVRCHADRLRGAEIVLRYPSVGATENLISASVKAVGETTLIGVAREPEVVSFCEMLNAMGAKIKGAGTSVIKIAGVDELHGAIIKPVTDRIVAGTIILATALTGGCVEIEHCEINHLGALVTKLISPKIQIASSLDGIVVESTGDIDSFNVSSGPYPKFPTDLQPIVTAVLCQGAGNCVVEEKVFENRFLYANELKKMGAEIVTSKDNLMVGCSSLKGANVVASDLRGGAGLVVAGLKAEGKTIVEGVQYIDRGYENIEKIFSNLGAKILRKSI
ncbi:MAG: UDP-N-acetylglucosamine 1-carboxyvinyltransferase [Clostridia bacterium]|nr:UDP-N-acetylglucosamine 1-carboxyvinyltransferase [Clostridia bacterium]